MQSNIHMDNQVVYVNKIIVIVRYLLSIPVWLLDLVSMKQKGYTKNADVQIVRNGQAETICCVLSVFKRIQNTGLN